MTIKRFCSIIAVFAIALCVSVMAVAQDFTVGCINCGAFKYENGHASDKEFKGAWKKLAEDWPQDVFFYEDVGRGVLGNVSYPRLDIRSSVKEDPVNVDAVGLPNEIEVEGKIRRSPRYRALRLTYDFSGKMLAVYGVHLVAEGHIRGAKPVKGGLSPSQKLRQKQFRALIDDARQFDFAILTGDFNAQKPEEYAIFTDAGFSIANCSEKYGVKSTLRKIPADNIIISPRLSFKNFKVLDGYLLNTDHLPLVAKVRFPDGVVKSEIKIPSVEEFLQKPAVERRRLFRDFRFRKQAYKENYPCGKGLLSRWVRVEKIPNLRDVGGIVNQNGIELQRGVFYRSAGWNDNAVIKKGRPESEWKAGKSRLTEEGKKAAIEKLRLKTDLDLRGDRECWGMTGSPIGEEVRWRHHSFGHYDEFEKKPVFKNSVKKVFEVLSDPESRPLVFHCIGGADRTGCLAFFVQALCDVDEETLIKDWELTCCYTPRLNFVHEKCIDRLLVMLSKYPGITVKERVKAFLRDCGVTESEMASVVAALLPVGINTP
jgi:protein-tyrosine phosphatase